MQRERGQDWKAYARSVLVFSVLGFGLLYLVLRTQTLHPFNPQDLSSPTWDLSFNTAASFVSNTNWQFYAGETTLSNFSQMFGLAVQNFVSAAVGIAVLAAFIRGLASRSTRELGNFYVDVTRVLLYILLPLSVLGGLFLALAGRAPEPRRAHAPAHAHRARADPRARARRLAGGDQAARDQRRRLLQRQLGDAVREPERGSRTSSRC